jgi:3-oxoacyl-[acyl-carrier-protein] synthase-3
MALGTIKGIKIGAIACTVPNRVRDASYWYDKFGHEAVDKFIDMTGVKSVYQSVQEQSASDLAYISAKAILKEKEIDPKEIGAIVFVTQGPDYVMPATAFVLQHRLGISNQSICFDVNLGCSGYVKGLNIITALMKNSDVSKALLLVGDTSTKGISTEDKSSAMLFGDSGSATLLIKDESSLDSKIDFHMRSDGNRFKAIIKPAGAYRNLNASKERVVWPVDGNIRSDYDTYMNGTDVFTFTIREVPKLLKDFFSETETSVEDYDCFSFHQANLYILRQIARKTRIPIDKMPISIDRFGNTSVTSIPLTLSDRYGFTNGNEVVNVLMCGFGVGLSWGVVSAEINEADIMPIIYSNEFFTEGGVSHD